MRTNRLIYLFIVVCFAVSVIGCHQLGIIKPENPKEAYLVALTEYNNLLELYLKNRDAPFVVESLKDEIEANFEKGSDILDAWWIALDIGERFQEKEVEFDILMQDIIKLVFKVMEVKE